MKTCSGGKEDSVRSRFCWGILIAVLAAVHLYGFTHMRFRHSLSHFFPEMRFSVRQELVQRVGEPYMVWVEKIRRETPPDSGILLPRRPPLPFGVKVNDPILNAELSGYFLFPRRVGYDGNPEISAVLGPLFRSSKTGEMTQIRTRVAPPEPILPDFAENVLTPINLITALGTLLLLTLSGYWLSVNVLSPSSAPVLWAGAFVLGLTQLTAFYLLAGFLGWPVTRGIGLAWFIFWGWAGIQALRRTSFSSRSRSAPPQWWVWVIPGFFFLLLFVKNLTLSIHGYDGVYVWGPKAKAIFALQGLSGYALWGAGPTHPPLIPIAMAQLAAGGTQTVNLLFPAFALVLYVFIYDALKYASWRPRECVLIPFFLFTAPMFFRHTMMAYANLPLTVCVTAAALRLPQAVENGTARDWRAIAFWLTAAVWIRPDGIAWGLYIALVGILWAWRRRRGLGLLWMTMPLTAWLVWILCYHIVLKGPADWWYADSPRWNWSHLASALRGTWEILSAVSDWGALPVLWLMALLLRGRELLRSERSLCFFVAIALLGLTVYSLGAVSRWDYDLYFRSAFNRYVMPLVPILSVMALRALRRHPVV